MWRRPVDSDLRSPRLHLRLEEGHACTELAHEDRLVVSSGLSALLEAEHVAVPGDRTWAVADVERHVVQSLQFETFIAILSFHASTT